MLLAAPFVLQEGPSVTISEVEIELPALARRYAEAIGEPVDVLPAVERRAVAIFARNEPWERVMKLAGEAGGFRLARKDERLRLEPSRPLSQASLETSLGRRILSLLSPPEDVADASEKQRAARAELNRLERSAKTRDEYRRAHELRGIVHAGTIVNSAETLALGRYLGRGGRLELADSVVFSAGGLLNGDEYGFFTANTKAAGASVGTLRIVARVTLNAIEVASTVRTPEGGVVRRSERIALDRPYDSETRTLLNQNPLETKRMPTPRFGHGAWTMGDYLRWMHDSGGKPCAAPALRVALSHPSDAGLDSSPDAGFTLRERDGALVATSELGEGLWPRDFRSLETLKSPGVRDYAKFASSMKPALRAASMDAYSFAGTHDMSPLNEGRTFLSFFASVPYDLASFLLDGKELAGDAMPPLVRRSLLASMADEAGPSAALSPLRPDLPLAVAMRIRSEKLRALTLDSGAVLNVGRDFSVDDDPRIEVNGQRVKTVEHQEVARDRYSVEFGDAGARYYRAFTLMRADGPKQSIGSSAPGAR